MFTVRNRDVKTYVAVTAISMIFIICMPVFPRSYTAIIKENTTANNTFRKDSYENYIWGRQGEKKTNFSSYDNIESENYEINISKESKYNKKSIQRIEHIKYKVHRGDTITKISKKFHVPATQIITLNNISKKGLKIGTILKISAKKKTPCQNIKKITPEKSHSSNSNRPYFRWPLHHVESYKSDGDNGVKPIGIIISGRSGASVVSAAPGTVKKIGHMRGYGKYIVIKHSGRFATVYANLSKITVVEGEKISAGNKIGYMAGSDKKIHFQIDYEGRPEDPLKYLPKNI